MKIRWKYKDVGN